MKKFIESLKQEAKMLADTDGINIEYNRALCELIAGVDGKIDSDHEQRTIEISVELNIKIA